MLVLKFITTQVYKFSFIFFLFSNQTTHNQTQSTIFSLNQINKTNLDDFTVKYFVLLLNTTYAKRTIWSRIMTLNRFGEKFAYMFHSYQGRRHRNWWCVCCFPQNKFHLCHDKSFSSLYWNVVQRQKPSFHCFCYKCSPWRQEKFIKEKI